MKKILVLLFALFASPAVAQVIPSGPWGSINYWGVGGASQVLNPGLAGQCLETQGTGSAPVWVACPGSALNLLPPINTNTFLGNVSGNYQAPTNVDVNTILNTVGYDIARPPPVEAILYKSNVGPTFNWQALPPGVTGALLTSGGPTNPPFWSPTATQANLASICQTVGAVLYFDTPSNLWKCLSPGTSGQLLQTSGASGNPSWLTLSGTAPITYSGGAIGVTGSALTSVNDTNVTATLGGTPATALLQPTSITMGWTGTLSVARGGTGASTAAGAATNLGALSIPVSHPSSGNLVGAGCLASQAHSLWWVDQNLCSTADVWQITSSDPSAVFTLTLSGSVTIGDSISLTIIMGSGNCNGVGCTISATAATGDTLTTLAGKLACAIANNSSLFNLNGGSCSGGVVSPAAGSFFGGYASGNPIGYVVINGVGIAWDFNSNISLKVTSSVSGSATEVVTIGNTGCGTRCSYSLDNNPAFQMVRNPGIAPQPGSALNAIYSIGPTSACPASTCINYGVIANWVGNSTAGALQSAWLLQTPNTAGTLSNGFWVGQGLFANAGGAPFASTAAKDMGGNSINLGPNGCYYAGYTVGGTLGDSICQSSGAGQFQIQTNGTDNIVISSGNGVGVNVTPTGNAFVSALGGFFSGAQVPTTGSGISLQGGAGPVIASENYGTSTLLPLTIKTSNGTATIAKAETVQVFTTGTNATYTTPTNPAPAWLEVEIVGGGGGGAGSGTTPGAATAGGNTCWNTSGTACTSPVYQGTGGGAGQIGTTAAGGGVAGSGTCSDSQTGGTGGAGTGATNMIGSIGGSSRYGGAGPGGVAASGNGIAASANTGSGGGGAGDGGTANTGGGGGGGGWCLFIQTSPAATYVYTIGAAGSAGTAGTSGFTGGAGAAGKIRVIEHYN